MTGCLRGGVLLANPRFALDSIPPGPGEGNHRSRPTHWVGYFCEIRRDHPTSILYEAGNISEAVKLGEQVHPQFALIDVVLEDEDGIQCARQLRSVSPSTRMVVVSAYPDRGFRKQGLLPSSTRRIWTQHLCGR